MEHNPLVPIHVYLFIWKRVYLSMFLLGKKLFVHFSISIQCGGPFDMLTLPLLLIFPTFTIDISYLYC